MQWTAVGHTKQKEHFERLLEEGAFAHAYLLAGPEGVGKKLVAEDLARALVPEGYRLDIMRLAPVQDPETGKIKDIPIEAVSGLKSWISLSPTGQHKVVIIDDADRLGHESANTLLKVLEEPPAYAYFILVSGKPGQVISTIASRCERVDFSLLSDSEMKAALAEYKIDADDRSLLAVVAGGKPGVAVQLLNSGRLSLVASSVADLEKTLKSGLAEKLVYAKKISDSEEAGEIISWWLSYVHAQLSERPQLASVAHGLLDLSSVIAQPHYNRRLAVEQFFLSHTVQK